MEMIGKKFGRWAVIGLAGTDKYRAQHWLCRCECGNEVKVKGASLRRGDSKSCGCLQKERVSEALVKDVAGQKFGKLTAVERVENISDCASWLCDCECGNTTIVRGSYLRGGHTKSCGCGKGRLRLPPGEAAFNQLFSDYKQHAKKRNRQEFSLSKEQFKRLTKQICFYCGVEPTQHIKSTGRNKTSYVYNGIDRVDNSKGYVPENCVPCCNTCNVAKQSMSLRDHVTRVTRSYNHLQSTLFAPTFVHGAGI